MNSCINYYNFFFDRVILLKIHLVMVDFVVRFTNSHLLVFNLYAGILRYLGGRFPETTSAVDENGRTALHYAATIKDNGHFYNLLVHLGSNPKAIDKVIHSILCECVCLTCTDTVCTEPF